MSGLLEFYQHIPENLDPVAFRFGSFFLSWYSLMYLAAFLTVYLLLRYRIKRGESLAVADSQQKLRDILGDFLIFSAVGVLFGGRLGYVLFYNLGYYLDHLWEIISPYDFSSGKFIGIYGMSYHGGMLGVFLATLIFVKKYRIGFWKWADFVVPAIPAGYLFGRIGNFLNGELYGRLTESPLGMYFLDERGVLALRYPSQLFEAALEGVALFIILWIFRKKPYFDGFLLALYLSGYGLFRFWVEFFREPDYQLGLVAGPLTLGQVLCLFMVFSGAAIYVWKRPKRMV